MKRFAIGMAAVTVLGLVLIGLAISQLPSVGAGALLFPTRTFNTRNTPAGCLERQFVSDGMNLRGWHCRTETSHRKGTIIYLHGVADNRGSSVAAIETLRPLGFNVISYDSRAHGDSGGDRCTYGYFEKRDLQHVIDQVGADEVIVIGHSLGAAVALQAAAIDPRVRAVVAASTFSDLRTIAAERVPYLPGWALAPAFERAERDGRFVLNDVSPERAGAAITVPVLLIHGSEDRETSPAHSERVFRVLRGRKELIRVPGAGHVDVLRRDVWTQIVKWIQSVQAAGSDATAR